MQKNKVIKFIGIILIIFGFLLSMVGLLFNIFRWPDMFKGIFTGPTCLIIGVILVFIKKMK